MLNDIDNILRELGSQMLDWRQKGVDGIWEGAQLKTEADILAHNFLTDKLKRIDNSIPIVSEENAESHSHYRPNKYWLIDPIDGTASLAGGFDGFVTQLALIVDKKPVLGAIYAPALNEMFLAKADEGATLNGDTLNASYNQNRKALIDNYPEPRGIAKQAYNELNCTNYVECGSLGLKICKTIDGTADLFIKDVLLKDWDVAPAELIVNEAGGHFSRLNGKKFIYDGDYYKQGIISASTIELVKPSITWFNEVYNKQRENA